METMKAIGNFGAGHVGGAMSMVEVLSVLYGEVMKYDPKNPKWNDRDWFICSKGHSGPSLYAALAIKGFFPKEELATFRKLNTRLQGHPSRKLLPGVEQSTGSLGQGLSSGIGMALAGRLDKKDYRVYVMMGDGEIQEGMVWEAVMAAGHYGLDNLCAFVDSNHLQIDGNVEEVMNPHPIDDKFRAFNWHVI
ncbi:MAG TPA: transketolase, partial [Paenibacillaceae bacterium]|nr:transketolase [Paenibacillaceae bacterium]